MSLIDTLVVDHQLFDKAIEVVEGDITLMGDGQEVDVLVISAFPRDYAPTSGSVIGALQRRGISVANLAAKPAYDLRREFSCWLSAPIDKTYVGQGFKRILCFEPGINDRNPADAVQDIFRALAPFIGADPWVTSVAMPLVACGDQQIPVEEIVEPLVDSAIQWMRTTPLHRVRIVELAQQRAERLRKAFAKIKERVTAEQTSESKDHDVFLSYSHNDKSVADDVVNTLRDLRPNVRIFRDIERLKTGREVLVQLDNAVRRSYRFLPLLSPEYVLSKYCQDEFTAAWSIRQQRHPDLFFPLCITKFNLKDPRMKDLFYQDCVAEEPGKLRQACAKLIDELEHPAAVTQ